MYLNKFASYGGFVLIQRVLCLHNKLYYFQLFCNCTLCVQTVYLTKLFSVEADSYTGLCVYGTGRCDQTETEDVHESISCKQHMYHRKFQNVLVIAHLEMICSTAQMNFE